MVIDGRNYGHVVTVAEDSNGVSKEKGRYGLVTLKIQGHCENVCVFINSV